MRRLALVLVIAWARQSAAAPVAVQCDDRATADLDVDGRLDDWTSPVLARAGAAPGAAPGAVIELRCRWDGEALGLALDLHDGRPGLGRGGGDDDRVEISVGAGAAITVSPGTATARPRITAPAGVQVADSPTPRGFSIEVRIPAGAIAELSGAPALSLMIAFRDADRATAGQGAGVALAATIVRPDRKDLLDDLLRATGLGRTDVRLDLLAELDPGREGKERLVAGGRMIGVLTDRFAFVTLPVATPADVKHVDLLALGPHGQAVISAVITQSALGGSRDLLCLWMVSSGQLEPLAQIEIRKQVGGKLLESGWKLVGGHRGPELWVEPRPAIGWTAETCGEACAEAADGADPIVPPWDPSRGGIAYRFTGAAIYRRDLALTRHAPERALVVATRAELLAIAGRAAAGQACHAARAQGTVDW